MGDSSRGLLDLSSSIAARPVTPDLHTASLHSIDGCSPAHKMSVSSPPQAVEANGASNGNSNGNSNGPSENGSPVMDGPAERKASVPNATPRVPNMHGNRRLSVVLEGETLSPATRLLAEEVAKMRLAPGLTESIHNRVRSESSKYEQVFGGTQEDLFRTFADRITQSVSKTEFLKALGATGLWLSDRRLKESMSLLSNANESMDFEEFRGCISPNIYLIDRAFQGDFVIPDFSRLRSEIESIYTDVRKVTEGRVATYIPQLGRVNPNQFGVAVCTIDGQRMAFGESNVEFCVQSCCKPLNYCLALEEHGEQKVHAHVGREPSGRHFNELTLNRDGKPHNPMINSGAIMICALVQPNLDVADRFDYVMRAYSKMAGNAKVAFNNAVYLSERQTADRNFALAYYMRENGAFPKGTDLQETLEFYFQCCSIEMTCESLSVIAGTLANGGTCPITGERIMSSEAARSCLSLMYSCGMYDYSGEFAFTVGLPAKSGVAGALLIVIPNVMGICTWSPALDTHGNSVRGVEFCKRLISAYNFHHYDNLVHVEGLSKRDPRKKKSPAKENELVNLLFAAKTGDLAIVRRLYLAEVGLSDADYDGRTALAVAASEGHLNIVDFLLSVGVEVNPRDRWGGTPYADAVRHKHDEVAELLKAYGGTL